MNLDRKSGVLLHITSLPGRWGMGELGPDACRFGEFLSAAGQSLWQILPAGPIGYGFSPYSSLSAFAGNHLLISFDELVAEGLLSEQELTEFPVFDSDHIDFDPVISAREKILFEVADRFESTPEFEQFCHEEGCWLNDYTLYMAIRETNDEAPWSDWPAELRDRDFQALDTARTDLAGLIRRHEVLQFLFSMHWKKVKSHFESLDIELIGDIPIFVAGDSVDVWANRELFFLEPNGQPTVVAGVPPDYFSETGQRWGNPLYDWAAHRAGAYKWWTERMHRTFKMVDIVRVDHFRGFEDYWEIPAAEPTAIKGKWIKGPGLEFFQAVEENLRSLPGFGSDYQLADHVIAEDLGIITDEVDQLRLDCGFPGMIVLQFRFGAEDLVKPDYCPGGIEQNSVVYSGTHDNDTTRSWFELAPEDERQRVKTSLHIDGSMIHQDFVNLAMRAPAKWAILPLQDIVGAGVRMNTPGTVSGNWAWRATEEMLSVPVAEELKQVTTDAGR